MTCHHYDLVLTATINESSVIEYALGMQKAPDSIPNTSSERFSGGKRWERSLPEDLGEAVLDRVAWA